MQKIQKRYTSSIVELRNGLIWNLEMKYKTFLIYLYIYLLTDVCFPFFF